MTRVRARLLLGIVFILVSWSAGAQEIRREHHNVNVSAGREGRLGYFASPDAACGKGAPPKIEVIERPNYGRLSTRPDRLKAYTENIPARAQNCRGKFVDVTAVYYKSASDFHGSDRVVLRVHFPGAANGPASVLIDTVFISVR
ncbi:MAG TPA: hypothetical protein VHD34_11825 [Xanthobacteraceae bacterium]|nr:hypothetical protein [Xanthobacteraceae bacterium]